MDNRQHWANVRRAMEIGDRGRTHELLVTRFDGPSTRHVTIAGEPDPWEAFLAFAEANLPIFGFGFIAGAMFTATTAYVWSFFL